MGATASVNSTDDFLSVAPPDFALDEFTWISILHSWETAESFSSTTYSIKVDGTSSPLMQPEEILAIIGYSWKSFEVCKPEDEEENVFQVQYFDLRKKSLIHTKCLESFLYSKYHENFTRPHTIPPHSVFTTLSFLVKTPDNKIASTELSGCVPLSDHNFFLNGPAPLKFSSSSQSKEVLTISEETEVAQESLRKGNWNSRLKDLLPGDKFDESRQNIRQTLIRVDTLLDDTMKSQNLFQHKYHIYMYYKRQCQAYQHLILEGITTEKGERYMKEYEHWKEMVNGVIEQMMSELLNPVFEKAESLLMTLIPSSSPSYSTVAPSLQTLKSSLREGFIVDIFHLADTLDQQETVAFEHLNGRFNMTPLNSLTPRKDGSESESVQDVLETETVTTNTTVMVTEVPVAESKIPSGTRRKSLQPDKKTNRRTLSPSSKLGEGRPQTAGTGLVTSASNFQFPTTAEAKTEAKAGEKKDTDKGSQDRRRKSVDPSQKFPSHSAVGSNNPPGKKRHFSVSSANPSTLSQITTLSNLPSADSPPSSPKSNSNNHLIQLPGPPLITLSASAANPLQIIKNASYQISRQKLIKRLELKKYHQSAQQDKQLIHSIRYEIIYFVFMIVIKEAMNNYMIKEYNLLENRLLTNFTRDIEELSIIQAKEFGNYLLHIKEKQRTESESSQGEEKEIEKETEKEQGEEVKINTEAVPPAREQVEHIESPRENDEKNNPNPTHPFFTPTPFSEVSDVNELRLKHDENKQKYENYLLEKRRVKRKAFEDAKNITLEKLSNKLTDIRAETENAMLSPAGLGKFKGIMKIIQMMKHNADNLIEN